MRIINQRTGWKRYIPVVIGATARWPGVALLVAWNTPPALAESFVDRFSILAGVGLVVMAAADIVVTFRGPVAATAEGASSE